MISLEKIKKAQYLKLATEAPEQNFIQ